MAECILFMQVWWFSIFLFCLSKILFTIRMHACLAQDFGSFHFKMLAINLHNLRYCEEHFFASTYLSSLGKVCLELTQMGKSCLYFLYTILVCSYYSMMALELSCFLLCQLGPHSLNSRILWWGMGTTITVIWFMSNCLDATYYYVPTYTITTPTWPVEQSTLQLVEK